VRGESLHPQRLPDLRQRAGLVAARHERAHEFVGLHASVGVVLSAALKTTAVLAVKGLDRHGDLLLQHEGDYVEESEEVPVGNGLVLHARDRDGEVGVGGQLDGHVVLGGLDERSGGRRDALGQLHQHDASVFRKTSRTRRGEGSASPAERVKGRTSRAADAALCISRCSLAQERQMWLEPGLGTAQASSCRRAATS
jgi:hypothetical protein